MATDSPGKATHHHSPTKASRLGAQAGRLNIPPQIGRNRQVRHPRLGPSPLAELPELEHISQNLSYGHVEAIGNFVADVAIVVNRTSKRGRAEDFDFVLAGNFHNFEGRLVRS